MRITKELLKEHNACTDGYKFFVRNNLIDFPFYKLPLVLNDNRYTRWFKTVVKQIYLDGAVNVNDTVKTYKDDNIYVVLKNEQIIQYIDKNVTVDYVYDENGKILAYAESTGFIATIKYENELDYTVTKYRDTTGLEFTTIVDGMHRLVKYSNNNNLAVKCAHGYNYSDVKAIYGTIPSGTIKVDTETKTLITDRNRNTIYHVDGEFSEMNLVILYPNNKLQQFNELFIPNF